MNIDIKFSQLRERILVERSKDDIDETGGIDKKWSEVATLYARAEYLSGQELIGARGIHPEVSLRFTIRYTRNVTADNRVVWSGKKWNIHAVLPDERRRYMFLLASA